MATGPSNIFNALSSLSQGMQLRLHILALSGDSPVSNAFTEEADRLGLTVRGRERKEREEQRRVSERMESMREQTARFQEEIRELQQAHMEALLENQEQLRVAKDELKRLRERAYEVTMPNGTVAKVYRDGDKVRADDGAEVSRHIQKAEDIPDSFPPWKERNDWGARVKALTEENGKLVEYGNRLEQAEKKTASGDMSADELKKLRAGLEHGMPDSVRAHRPSAEGARRSDAMPAERNETSFESRATAMRSFADATTGLLPASPSEDPSTDFRKRPQADVSAPGPK